MNRNFSNNDYCHFCVFPLILKSTLKIKLRRTHIYFFFLFYNLTNRVSFVEFLFVVSVKCHCLSPPLFGPFFSSFNGRDLLNITGILLSSHNPHSIVGKIDGSGEKCTGKKRAATSKYYRAHHLDRPISKCIELPANA